MARLQRTMVLWLILGLVALSLSTSGCGSDSASQPGPVSGGGRHRLAYFTPNGTLVRMDVPGGGKLIPAVSLLQGAIPMGLSWSPDGEMLAYAALDSSSDGSVLVYEASGPFDQPVIDLQFEAFDVRPRGVAWSYDGSYLLVDSGTGPAGEVVVYRLESGEEVRRAGYLCGFCPAPHADLLAVSLPPEGGGPGEEEDLPDLSVVGLGSGEVRTLLAADGQLGYCPVAWPEPERLVARTYGSGARGFAVVQVNPEDDASRAEECVELPQSIDPSRVLALMPEEMQGSFSGSFCWSSDGAWCAAVFTEDGNPFIRILAADGEQMVDVGPGCCPAWCPTN